ncbi:MAG: tetratricopeptide repeat protein [Deltaproteobacteria bacterium]|nr:tetratricopeptide repeat protein [Deltaproteobacteria bacterium]
MRWIAPRRSNASWWGRLLALLLGLATVLVVAEVGLRGVGFAARWAMEYRNREDPGEGWIRILCVGESTTAGLYPRILEQILREQSGYERIYVVNRGIPGADTSVILAGLETELDRWQPQAVVAMMGASDHGGAIPWDDLPLAERTGWTERWKVAKAIRYLAYTMRQERAGRVREAANTPVPLEPEVARSALEAEIQGNLAEAEARFAQARAEAADPVSLLVAWGGFLERHERFEEAQARLEEAVRLGPGNVEARLALGTFTRGQGRMRAAERIFREALEIEPNQARAWYLLGNLLVFRGRPEEARSCIERAVALDPSLVDGWLALVPLVRASEGDAALDDLVERALVANPESDTLLGLAAHHWLATGRTDEAEAAFRRANTIRLQWSRPMTVWNYQRMQRILADRGIELVVMPYPMRETEPLRMILGDAPGVTYVDHEDRFRTALAREGYDALFVDHCNGDSGHATVRGDTLLAQSAAEPLLDLIRSGAVAPSGAMNPTGGPPPPASRPGPRASGDRPPG